MKAVEKFFRTGTTFALGTLAPVALLLALGTLGAPGANAQAPYLLPYTIQVAAGGGTAPAVGAICVGTNGVTGTAVDALGDGCPVTSGLIVTGSSLDLHDVVVDAQGNVYFLDNQSAGVVRRIDARSGLVTVYAGTPGAQTTVGCTTTIDKYGDGCLASDGLGNVVPVSTTVPPGPPPPYLYTANLTKDRGLGISRNGDLYIAGYSENLIHVVPLKTGILTLVAGVLGGGTVAKPTGNIGQKGYTGDGALAVSGEVFAPRGVGVDASGNVYIADSSNNSIRKVTASTGIITTLAGSPSGVAGFSGDGGPATAAFLTTPEDVQVDSSGNLYIGDFGNNRVRIIFYGGAIAANLIALTNPGTTAVAGNIYTIMGGGPGVYTPGSVVLATSVPVAQTRKLAVDPRGNVFLADNGNNVVWFLDASTGYMRVVAGSYQKTSGTPCASNTDAIGDNCPGTQAFLLSNSALGVGLDAFGSLYISDSGNKLLRILSTDQTFRSLAPGSSQSQVLDVHFAPGDAPAATAGFVLSGSPDYTIAGSTCTANADSTTDCLVTVQFSPTRPGIDTANLTVTSQRSGLSVLGISGIGLAAAVALDPGATAPYASGLASPQGIAQDAAGNVYIADTGTNRVLRFTAAGTSTLLAGSGAAGYTGDGAQATSATLSAPKAVTVDRRGFIYIADTGNNVIRRVDTSTGIISTVAGGASAVCSKANDPFGDGCLGTSAAFVKPAGIASDIDGNIYIADTGNNLIRELSVGGTVSLIGGGAASICTRGDVFGNGCTSAGATFNAPTGLAVDANRNVYVADTGNNEVRKLTAQGTVVLLAGTGVAGASGNGGPGTGAQLSGPTGVAVDAGANVYIADTGNSVIRLVNSLGNISSTVGTLSASGKGTLPGSAFAVQLNAPAGVVSTGAGRLVVLDSGNSRAFSDDRSSVTFDFGRTNIGFTSPTLQITETSTGSVAAALSTPAGSPAPPLFTITGASAQFTLGPSGPNGCSGGQILAPGASCLLTGQFSPTALGPVSATYTEATTNTVNIPAPFITVTGTGAVLTRTTATTVVTTPATGSPQYSVPFTVTTTISPASCNTAAPSCFPTGTVTFRVDGTQVGLAVPLSATGVASQTISGLSVGTHPVVAVYSGDGFYASSSAASLAVSIAQGATTTAVSANPASAPQFTPITLTASVTTAIAGLFPTGTVNFFAGTTLIGSGPVSAKTGVAILQDVPIVAVPPTPAHLPSSFGLPAGTYSLTAVYTGDANYAASTSAATALTIGADPATLSITLSSNAAGTAQGSTAFTLATVTPSNTVNGVVTLACVGMPQNSVCTFSPTSLNFTPTAGPATPQQVQVTLWTDIPPGVNPAQTAKSIAPRLFGRGCMETSMAGMLAWPVVLLSLVGFAGFHKQIRGSRLLAGLALFALLSGLGATLSGCSASSSGPVLTPVGTYNIQIVATGPNSTTASTPVTFVVAPGLPGQF